MLDLIFCEFAKLKRKKFIPFVLLSAFLFPIPLSLLMTMPQMAEANETAAEVFNEYYSYVLGDGVQLLLPCVLGIIAAMLFFMERDHDTFKNLRVIPVTGTQLIFAKISVLFCFGVLFSLMSAVAAALCGTFFTEVTGMGYKLLLALEMGIFVTAGTLPLVVLIVFCSKTYVFSILMCVFYVFGSLTLETGFGVLPKLVCWLAPIPLTTLWCVNDMIRHGARTEIPQLRYLMPSTLQTAAILTATAVLSVLLIDYLYKKRGED